MFKIIRFSILVIFLLTVSVSVYANNTVNDNKSNNQSLNMSLLDAAKNNDYNKVAKLLNEGANINTFRDKTENVNMNTKDNQTLYGKTALMYAVVNNNIKMAKLLISKGADITIVDYNMDTALVLAAKYNLLDMVKLLLDHGAAIVYYFDDDADYYKRASSKIDIDQYIDSDCYKTSPEAKSIVDNQDCNSLYPDIDFTLIHDIRFDAIDGDSIDVFKFLTKDNLKNVLIKYYRDGLNIIDYVASKHSIKILKYIIEKK